MHATDLDYMSLALSLAERGRLTVAPNPMVGCVLVKNNTIVAADYHREAGKEHAEVLALQAAGENARGAIAYVTLEPCCHTGKTPPCTDAFINAGIRKVYVASRDPNPLVAGKGIAALEAAGIKVEVGLGSEEALRLNATFFHYIKTKRPFVIAKWAMSLDGKTCTHPKDSRMISNADAQRAVHDLRQQVDAILIGANTANQDDPLLTARLSNPPHPAGKQPLRIVLTSQGELSPTLKLFQPDLPGKTLVVTTPAARLPTLPHHVEILRLANHDTPRVALLDLLQELGKREITSLLVEGGNQIHEQFFAEQLVNQVYVYIAPVIISSLEKKRTLKNMQTLSLGNNTCFIAEEELNDV